MRIARDIDEIRQLKRAPGKNIHAVGGATLVSSLMNAGLIDEVHLTVHPLILGRGKPLFNDVTGRHPLELVDSQPLPSGRLTLVYRVAAADGRPHRR